MSDDTYFRYKNLIRFGRILGFTNLKYEEHTIYVSRNSRKSAVLLALFAYLIYDSAPSPNPTQDVYYSKRNVSHFIEHFLVALLIIGFTCASIKASEQLATLLKAQRAIDVKLVARLKVQFNKSRVSAAFRFAVVYVSVVILAGAAIYFYGKVRKSLVIKLVLANTLFFIVGIMVETLIWLVEKINVISKVLREADKNTAYCGLCLKLESQLFDSLCFKHKLIITEEIYNETCDVISLLNDICPLHLFYLMAFFEVTGELLYFVPLVFKSQPIDYNVCFINIVLIVITCCGFLIGVFSVEWILLKMNGISNNIYKLQTSNVKIIEFTRRILLNPLKFTFAGNNVNLNYALQIANSVIIYCSMLITFNYVV